MTPRYGLSLPNRGVLFGATSVDELIALSEQVYDGGETRTDSFGRWALTGLRPGPYKVHALGKGVAAEGGKPIELQDGQTTTLALELGRDGSAGKVEGGMYAQAPATK